jgi:hypothetical protein
MGFKKMFARSKYMSGTIVLPTVNRKKLSPRSRHLSAPASMIVSAKKMTLQPKVHGDAIVEEISSNLPGAEIRFRIHATIERFYITYCEQQYEFFLAWDRSRLMYQVMLWAGKGDPSTFNHVWEEDDVCPDILLDIIQEICRRITKGHVAIPA